MISFSSDDGDGAGGTFRWRDDRVKVICLLARGGGGETGEEGVQGEAASADVNQSAHPSLPIASSSSASALADVNQSAHPFLFVCILVSSASGKKSAWKKKKKVEERMRGNASKAICQSTASSSPTSSSQISASSLRVIFRKEIGGEKREKQHRAINALTSPWASS